MARNKAIDWMRRQTAAAEREARWTTMNPKPESVVDYVCSTDQAARVRRALQSLGPQRRQAIALAYYGGLSYQQVAKALEIPEGTAKTRIRQGLLQLRAELGRVSFS